MSSSPGPAPARGPVAGGRVGLSEYTAQRLAELRARRVEADSTDSTTYTKPVAPAPRPSATTTTSSRADSATRPTATMSSAADIAVNGLKTDTPATGNNSYSSYSSQRAAATDATSTHSHAHSTTVSSPYHHHQQQQQHHYVTASSRSSSSNRHESSVAVDMVSAQQVTIHVVRGRMRQYAMHVGLLNATIN